MDFTGQPIRLADSLTDGLVVLDAHVLADARAHWEGEDDEMRLRFESPRRPTLEQTRASIGRWIAARAAGGPMIGYALRDPSGVLMGGCEIRPLSPERANLSYWVFPAFRKQGHAMRALILLSEAAAAIEGLQHLEAHIDADNRASRRVAEKAGFVEAGFVTDESQDAAPSSRILYVRRVAPEPAAKGPS